MRVRVDTVHFELKRKNLEFSFKRPFNGLQQTTKAVPVDKCLFFVNYEKLRFSDYRQIK